MDTTAEKWQVWASLMMRRFSRFISVDFFFNLIYTYHVYVRVCNIFVRICGVAIYCVNASTSHAQWELNFHPPRGTKFCYISPRQQQLWWLDYTYATNIKFWPFSITSYDGWILGYSMQCSQSHEWGEFWGARLHWMRKGVRLTIGSSFFSELLLRSSWTLVLLVSCALFPPFFFFHVVPLHRRRR